MGQFLGTYTTYLVGGLEPEFYDFPNQIGGDDPI
jgi:hypothetical protein